MDSIRRTLVAVLARELNPYMKVTNVRATPTVVPVVTTTISTSPLAATVSAQITAIPTTSNQTTMNTTAGSSETISVVTSPIVTPVSTIESTSPIVDLSTSAQPAVLVSHNPTELLTNGADVLPIGRDMTIDTTSHEQLMSLPELTKIFNKSCSRRNMAVNMVRALVDEETRKQCNVMGRGKDMLDPVVVSYVKAMSFQFFPLSGSEKMAEEWSKCKISIDESSRRLKNKPRKEKP